MTDPVHTPEVYGPDSVGEGKAAMEGRTEAPKRIWQLTERVHTCREDIANSGPYNPVEYVRSDLHTALQARVAELEGQNALLRQAVNDWLWTYASELCREEDVKAARERISKGGGVLNYIAEINAALNKGEVVLQCEEPPSWAKDPWNENEASKCDTCGCWLEIVRPGKSQCPNEHCADKDAP